MNTDDLYVWALCVWREAMGEKQVGMLGVAWVMWNRLQNKFRGAETMHDVVEDKEQFSSMTHLGDPMTVEWPTGKQPPANLAAWVQAQREITAVFNAGQSQDPTNGAMYYFNPRVVKPEWAAGLKLVATIGNHEFYR